MWVPSEPLGLRSPFPLLPASLFPSLLPACFLCLLFLCFLRCNLHAVELKCKDFKGSFINPDKSTHPRQRHPHRGRKRSLPSPEGSHAVLCAAPPAPPGHRCSASCHKIRFPSSGLSRRCNRTESPGARPPGQHLPQLPRFTIRCQGSGLRGLSRCGRAGSACPLPPPRGSRRWAVRLPRPLTRTFGRTRVSFSWVEPGRWVTEEMQVGPGQSR